MIEYSQRGGFAGVDRRLTLDEDGSVILRSSEREITARLESAAYGEAKAEISRLPRPRGGRLAGVGSRLLKAFTGVDQLRVELKLDGERIADPAGPDCQAAIEILDRIDAAARHQADAA